MAVSWRSNPWPSIWPLPDTRTYPKAVGRALDIVLAFQVAIGDHRGHDPRQGRQHENPYDYEHVLVSA